MYSPYLHDPLPICIDPVQVLAFSMSVALEDMDALLKVSPGHPEATSQRGMAMVLAGDVDGGLAEQDKALRAANRTVSSNITGMFAGRLKNGFPLMIRR